MESRQAEAQELFWPAARLESPSSSGIDSTTQVPLNAGLLAEGPHQEWMLQGSVNCAREITPSDEKDCTDFVFYGFGVGFEGEWGNMSLSQMLDAGKSGYMRVELDICHSKGLALGTALRADGHAELANRILTLH